jgi:hypothetical protein
MKNIEIRGKAGPTLSVFRIAGYVCIFENTVLPLESLNSDRWTADLPA